MEAVRNFEGAVVIITHNERILKKVPKRLVVFDRGKHSLFEGSYDDFLQEVGWRIEENRFGSDPKTDKLKSVSRKSLRRLKAGRLQEKSRALKAYIRKIQKLETSIADMERDIHERNEGLIQASSKNDGDKIAELSRSIRGLQSDVELLYEELDKVTRQLECEEQKYR